MSVLAENAPTPLRRNREFNLLWAGAGFSYLGSRMTALVYPILVLWSGGSTTVAGLLGFTALLPQLVVQLPAGAHVDRRDRRRRGGAASPAAPRRGAPPPARPRRRAGPRRGGGRRGGRGRAWPGGPGTG